MLSIPVSNKVSFQALVCQIKLELFLSDLLFTVTSDWTLFVFVYCCLFGSRSAVLFCLPRVGRVSLSDVAQCSASAQVGGRYRFDLFVKMSDELVCRELTLASSLGLIRITSAYGGY